MSDKSFIVNVPSFEGPLDLLLSLIEKKKLCINDVSLAEITDNFLAHVRELEVYSFERATEFIGVASTLILIKSASLLPSLSLTTDESKSIEDLEQRLREYQRIKELAEHVRVRFGRSRLFSRGYVPTPHVAPIFAPSRSLSVGMLRGMIQSLIEARPPRLARPEVSVGSVLRLEDVVASLVARVERAMSTSFREFIGERREKVHVIVHFLAMLELVKQGTIYVRQENDFEDISIETRTCVVPHYGY